MGLLGRGGRKRERNGEEETWVNKPKGIHGQIQQLSELFPWNHITHISLKALGKIRDVISFWISLEEARLKPPGLGVGGPRGGG